MKRSFLFLQGVCSPFWGHLADSLRAEGHKVFKVNFNAGDRLYWGRRSAWNYRDDLDGLRDFLDGIYRQHGITDQILFGDRRPVHRPAVEHGEVCGVRTHVFEEGYFRPYWVTLEREGVNGHSLLPRDPNWFLETGKTLPDPDRRSSFDSPFRIRAAHDVAYHVAGMLNPLLYSGYRTHAPVNAPVEYAAYVKRFSWLRLIRSREQQRVSELTSSGAPYFFLPLQLNSDAQILDHSHFSNMGEVIEYVLESFARHAPSDALIAIKNHPLDTGLLKYEKIIRECEHRFGLTGRTVYFEDGDISALVRQARGVVTVNSTVGIVALEQGRPTLALSDPIYNLTGLTCQMPLDAFWSACQPPENELFMQFRKVVMDTTQINGGFYCRKGIALAVGNSLRFLTSEHSPLEELL